MDLYTFRRSVLFASLLAAGCGGGTDPIDVPAPRVVSFAAAPMTVSPGETTTLTYQVVGAQGLRIETEAGQSVLPQTNDPQPTGSVITNGLDVTTTFLLVAVNAAGTSTSAVTVTVDDGTGPRIDDFSATPSSITDGMSSTLGWRTQNGVSGRIELEGTPIHAIGAGELAAGTFGVTPTATRTYKLVLVGQDGAEVEREATVTVSPATGPVVRSFVATPSTVDAGMSANLAWEVTGAQSVTITDPAGQSLYSGAELTRTLPVTPTQTTTYTLVATDSGGAMATAMVAVTVNLPTGAQVVSFTANPATVTAGASSDLSWTVTDAPGGIEISAGGSIIHTDANLTGTFSVTPVQTTTYTLVAKNPVGDATAMGTVTVTTVDPVISSFTAAPNPTALGGVSTLSWTTVDATQVRVLLGGAEVFSTTTSAASGTFAATLAAEVNDYVLEASRPNRPAVTQAITVYGHPVPAINALSVNPGFVSGPTSVTVTWDVSDVSALSLDLDGAPVPGFPMVSSATAAIDAAGSMPVMVTGAATFTLMATSAGGSVSRQVQVASVVVVAETEPNDQIAQAQPIGGSTRVSGTLSPAGDIDIYRVTVPNAGNVFAETSDGMGACLTDTVLILADLQGNTITFDEGSGPAGGCARIDPTTDPAAGNLAAGDYLIGVLHQQPTGTGAYTLDVEVGGPACGNDVVETLVNEQCDFGDTNNGDGCSATCQLEIHPTVIGAAGGVVQISLANPDAIAVIRVDVPNPGMAITATAADVGGATCNAVDTAINLGDSAFGLLGAKTDGGPVGSAGDCATIRYPGDLFAVDLDAGTYYLVVFNTGTTAGAVEVSVGVRNAVCGNGVLEGGAGEQCDNAPAPNAVPCNAMCQVQTGGAATLPTSAPAVFAGSLASGFELYRITVTAETYLRAETFSPNQAGGCNADTVIELYDETFAFLGLDDDSGTNSCSRIDERHAFARLAPGTYWGLVAEANGGALAAYEVVFSSFAVNAASPVLEIEPNDSQAAAMATGLSGPGVANLHGQTSPDGDDDVYAFVVPANTTVTVSAQTYDQIGNPTGCTASNALTDTRMFLEQAGVEATGPGTGELAYSDDISGTQWCSRISGQVLAAGAADATYFIRVQGYEDAGVRQYFLNVTLQ